MILMLAPGPNVTFGSMPSGAFYVSDQHALIYIANDSAADQAALQAVGCALLSPFGGWGNFGFANLSDLFAADVVGNLVLPDVLGFPQYTTVTITNDPTSSNDGSWIKTGTGHGSGNWSQSSTQTLASLSTLPGVIAAETTRAEAAEATNAAAIAAETARAEAAEALKATITALTAETTRAEAAETANATAIMAETTRAEAAESALNVAITVETTRAQAVEGTKATAAALSAEVSRAETAEAALNAAITAETRRAQGAEAALTAVAGSATLAQNSAIAASGSASAAQAAAATATSAAGAAATSATTASSEAAIAIAAATASAAPLVYATYAAAVAAIGSIPNNAVVQIIADETRSGHRTMYQAVSGALNFLVDLSIPVGTPIYVDTMAQLLAYSTTGLAEGQRVELNSYNTPISGVPDAGGGSFRLTRTAPAGSPGTLTGVNILTIFESTASPGSYWERIWNGSTLRPEWSGIAGDLSVDVTTQVQAMFALLGQGMSLKATTQPKYRVSTVEILNTLGVSFGADNIGRSGGMELFYDGTAGGTVLEVLSSFQPSLHGITIDMNTAAIGVSSDTAASGGTITSSEVRHIGLCVNNNLNTANAVGYWHDKSLANNNEFFQYIDCSYFGMPVATATDTAYQQGANVNDHYNTFVRWTVFGAQNGMVLTGGVQLSGEGFNDVSAVQVAYNIPRAAGHPVDIRFSDHEQCWQITKGQSNGYVTMSHSRIAGCGKAGLALFDCTGAGGGISINQVEFTEIDVISVSAVGAYLIDFTGVTQKAPMLFRANIYNQRPAAGNFNALASGGHLITEGADEILGLGVDRAQLSTASQNLHQINGVLTTTGMTCFAIGGVLTLEDSGGNGPGSVATFDQTDGTPITTINIDPTTASLFLGAIQCMTIDFTALNAMTFQTGGNVGTTISLSAGQSGKLFFNSTYQGGKWVISKSAT